jgi:hypothetical protein
MLDGSIICLGIDAPPQAARNESSPAPHSIDAHGPCWGDLSGSCTHYIIKTHSSRPYAHSPTLTSLKLGTEYRRAMATRFENAG